MAIGEEPHGGQVLRHEEAGKGCQRKLAQHIQPACMHMRAQHQAHDIICCGMPNSE